MIGQRTDEDRKIKRLFVINYSLLALFQKAYPEVFRIPASRMVIDAPPDTRKAINKRYSIKYCYEIITQPSTKAEIEKYMQEDLFRAFHLRAKTEARSMSCYVLKQNSNITHSLSGGGTSGSDVEPNAARKFIRNEPVSDLAGIIEFVIHKPVIDETKFTGNVDIEFPEELYSYSPERLAAFLKARGFMLLPATRSIKAIVLTEKQKIIGVQ